MDEGSEEERKSQIIDEQSAVIAELEKELSIVARANRAWATLAWILRDDAAKLDSELEVVKAKLANYEQSQESGSEQVNMRQLATEIVSRHGLARKGVSASIDIPANMVLPAKQTDLYRKIIDSFASSVSEHAVEFMGEEMIVAVGYNEPLQLTIIGDESEISIAFGN